MFIQLDNAVMAIHQLQNAPVHQNDEQTENTSGEQENFSCLAQAHRLRVQVQLNSNPDSCRGNYFFAWKKQLDTLKHKPIG